MKGCWDEGDLPLERPLAMPIQDLHRRPEAAHAPLPQPGLAWRRGFLIGGSGLIGLVASCGIAHPLAVDGFDVVDQALAILSLALFAWISFGFLNALAGLVVLLRARGSAVPHDEVAVPRNRVAILVPVYNEDVEALERRLGRMTASLASVRAGRLFDLFVLSDSSAFAEAAERAACRRLRRRSQGGIYYRRRVRNVARKPGNIADWVRRFGGGYESMIVLDADSLMSGAAMARMACAMEADPGLGLIQTNPQLTGGRTLFARWQQFATMLYGPVASAGLEWWSGDEATFWGHNAILRVRAFAGSCGLPALPGAAPFGGEIMSHDMVEAALIRRRGWRARMMPLTEGSYEESPPTTIDHAIRDRRWCQGNLQHLRLLDAAGLHWLSRLQLLMGASGYLTSPLWLLLLVMGLGVAIRSGTPMADLGTPPWLIGLTVALLFGTRLMALAWAVADRGLAHALGGWRAILLGVGVEIPLSIIAAPIIMASQCLSIAEIVAGRRSGWLPQRRDTDGLALGEALDHYRWHMLLGLVFWTVSLSELGGAMWELPVALGLLGAPFVATFTSRADVGALAARHGIFSADPGMAEPAPASLSHAPARPALVELAA